MGACFAFSNADGGRVPGTDDSCDAEEALEPPIRNLQSQGNPQMINGASKDAHQCIDRHQDASTQIDPQVSLSESLKVDHNLNNAHGLSVPELVTLLGTDLGSGLSETQATARLQRNGPNRVKESKAISPWEIFMRQISNSLTVVLVITMGISFAIHDYIEGSVIAAVIVLNIVIGFAQDYRAEQQVLSLQALTAPECKVLRDGLVSIVKAETLVVGDVVKLSVGDIVPADLRLVDGINVSMDEAILTGESLPAMKTPSVTIAENTPSIGDRINMCYATTTMTMGRATALVVSTGMTTEVGTIASLLHQKKQISGNPNIFIRSFESVVNSIRGILGLTGTPLQIKLSKFALILFALAVLLAIIVFSVNLWDVNGDVLIYGICVAVAIIPESLVAVLTISMAVGTKSMARGNVIVRKLASLEAIGGVNAICSDKTGTLTQGKMIVRKAWVPELGVLTVHNTKHPLDPSSGDVRKDDVIVRPSEIKHKSLARHFFRAIALCNVSSVYNVKPVKSSGDTISTEDSQVNWTALGDPTEISLQVFAMRFECGKTWLLSDASTKLVTEFPFDSTLKLMTVVYENSQLDMIEVYTKGASEVVIPLLSTSEGNKQYLHDQAERMAAEGLRVLCVAYKYCNINHRNHLSSRKQAESELVFGGLVGMYDPPRLETVEAVQKCQRAGIAVHMLTGDHVGTARAVAREVGILQLNQLDDENGKYVVNAHAFDKLSDTEIDQLEELPLVLARCSPSTKVRMVDALQRRKQFCVMTGDGVNDSPSLKQANVGIAMGLTGSDVAKDTADMILTDDNFASIVKAVEEGRRLFDNIQKFLLHLLISNIAQVILLLVGLAFRAKDGHSVFPLSPLEILWVNLVTSSFLAIGLGLEEASSDIMLRPPHSLIAGVFTPELIMDKMIYGAFLGSLCLAAFTSVAYWSGNGELGLDCNAGWNKTCDITFRARAAAWATLTVLLLVTALEVKHFSRSLFALNPERYAGHKIKGIFAPIWCNKFLVWAVVAGFVIMFPVIYLPMVNKTVFKHMGISWEWGVVFGCLTIYVALVESWKALKRHFGIGTQAKRIAGFQTV